MLLPGSVGHLPSACGLRTACALTSARPQAADNGEPTGATAERRDKIEGKIRSSRCRWERARSHGVRGGAAPRAGVSARLRDRDFLDLRTIARSDEAVKRLVTTAVL